MGRKFTLIAATFIAAMTSSAQAAQNFDLTTADFSTWTLFGSATSSTLVHGGYTYRNIALTTSGIGGTAGAAFAPGPVTLDVTQPFSFAFNFFIAPGAVLRGDGLTFVMTDLPMLGSAGSGLGYEGSPGNSVAFAVDTFHFTGEPVSPSLQILTGGSVDSRFTASVETGLDDGIRDESFQWHASVSWTPDGGSALAGTLTGSISHPSLGTHSVSYAMGALAIGSTRFDSESGLYLGNQLYFGFTAANGLADDGHFITSAVPVPEPETWATLLVGLGLVGGRLRQRAARMA